MAPRYFCDRHRRSSERVLHAYGGGKRRHLCDPPFIVGQAGPRPQGLHPVDHTESSHGHDGSFSAGRFDRSGTFPGSLENSPCGVRLGGKPALSSFRDHGPHLLIYLIGGSFIDDLAFMVLATPILYPAVVKLNYDPIWFGTMIILTVMIGIVVPPVAICVFRGEERHENFLCRHLQGRVPVSDRSYRLCDLAVYSSTAGLVSSYSALSIGQGGDQVLGLDMRWSHKTQNKEVFYETVCLD